MGTPIFWANIIDLFIALPNQSLYARFIHHIEHSLVENAYTAAFGSIQPSLPSLAYLGDN